MIYWRPKTSFSINGLHKNAYKIHAKLLFWTFPVTLLFHAITTKSSDKAVFHLTNNLQSLKIELAVELSAVSDYFRSHLSLILKPWSVPVLLVLNWNSTVASPTDFHSYSAGLSSIITFHFNEFHPKVIGQSKRFKADWMKGWHEDKWTIIH